MLRLNTLISKNPGKDAEVDKDIFDQTLKISDNEQNANNFESKILAKLRDGKDGENVFEKVLIMKDKGIISLIE